MEDANQSRVKPRCALFVGASVSKDAYGQVRVLFSIILGLGISQILSASRVLKHGKEYRFYWVYSHGFLICFLLIQF